MYRPVAAHLALSLLITGAGANVGATSTTTPGLQAQVVEKTGYFRQYALDHTRSGPAIVAVDENNAVWTALARSGRLARYANDRFTFFDFEQNSRPVGVVPDKAANGRRGVLWVSAAFDQQVIRFNSLTGQKDTVDLSQGASWPFMVVLTQAGDVWFTQRAGNRLGRIDPQTLAVTHYEVPEPGAGPAGLAEDPLTGALWFTQSTGNRVTRFDPATQAFESYALGEPTTGMTSGPAGIAVGPDGHVWFAKLEGKLGHIAPGADQAQLIDVPDFALRPAGITVGPGGDVWLLALDGNCILRYQREDHRFVAYALPTGGVDDSPQVPPAARTSRPFGLDFDQQGNLWVSEQYTGRLTVLDVAPPSVEVFSPTATVKLLDPLVTLRAMDAVAGVSTVKMRLDGIPVDAGDGRLSMLHVVPGDHVLSFEVFDNAGHSTIVQRAFAYDPTLATLSSVIRALPIEDAVRESLVADLRGEVVSEEQVMGVYRAAKQALLADGVFDYFPALTDTFAHVAGTLVGSTSVSLIDEQPYFSRAKVTVRQGDEVTLRYDPPQKGHGEPSSVLRNLSIDGGERLAVLHAGESFTQRFDEVGTYLVQDSSTPGAGLTVVVVPKTMPGNH